MRPWLLLLTLLAACSRPGPLPIYGQVPDFELTAQNSQPFGRTALDGSIWVADFIYTTCHGPCPMMSARMRRVQGSTPPGIKLVSFSVDPAHDTPEILSEYARRYHAEPDRWFFLTGAHNTLQRLSHDAFHLSDASLTHSTRLVLVDRHARIRGYYSTSDDSAIRNLLADIRRLEKEPA
jgi:protein SCO1